MSEPKPVIAYGLEWAPIKVGDQYVPCPEWMMHRDMVMGRHNCEVLPDFKGKAFHFMRFCDTFFSDPKGLFYMQWNPNAVRIIEAFFKHKMVSVMGCASSGKSRSLACIAVGMFLIDPINTKVLVTSTTVQTAKGKIWGDISFAWDQVCQVYANWGFDPPGQKMTGDPIIRYEAVVNGLTVTNHKAGIELVPTQQSSEKQSMTKVQGYKNMNVIFLGDEWDTLGHGLLNTVKGNLKSNSNSRCVAAFNPTGRTTPGGKISKPIGGWEVITIDDDEWLTEVGGICLRFDARKSPNVIAGREVWLGLPTIATIADYKTSMGEDSLEWWSQVCAWFAPTGETQSIYSQAEVMIQYHADHAVNTWLEDPIWIAGLDPGYVHGGDHSYLVIGRVGRASINGRSMIVCERMHTINLDKEITDLKSDKPEEVVRLTKKYLHQYSIDVKNLAVDISGAAGFASLLSRDIGSGFIAATFNGKPTAMPISKSDKRKACDVYEDLVSELWYGGKPLIREGQLRGIDPDTVDEMCERSFSGGIGVKIRVEPKKIMKKRLHRSPDRSDAYFLMVFVAKMRHGLSSVELAANHKARSEPLTDLGKFYQDNPHLLPKKTSRFKKRQKYERLEEYW